MEPEGSGIESASVAFREGKVLGGVDIRKPEGLIGTLNLRYPLKRFPLINVYFGHHFIK